MSSSSNNTQPTMVALGRPKTQHEGLSVTLKGARGPIARKSTRPPTPALTKPHVTLNVGGFPMNKSSKRNFLVLFLMFAYDISESDILKVKIGDVRRFPENLVGTVRVGNKTATCPCTGCTKPSGRMYMLPCPYHCLIECSKAGDNDFLFRTQSRSLVDDAAAFTSKPLMPSAVKQMSGLFINRGFGTKRRTWFNGSLYVSFLQQLAKAKTAELVRTGVRKTHLQINRCCQTDGFSLSDGIRYAHCVLQTWSPQTTVENQKREPPAAPRSPQPAQRLPSGAFVKSTVRVASKPLKKSKTRKVRRLPDDEDDSADDLSSEESDVEVSGCCVHHGPVKRQRVVVELSDDETSDEAEEKPKKRGRLPLPSGPALAPPPPPPKQPSPRAPPATPRANGHSFQAPLARQPKPKAPTAAPHRPQQPTAAPPPRPQARSRPPSSSPRRHPPRIQGSPPATQRLPNCSLPFLSLLTAIASSTVPDAVKNRLKTLVYFNNELAIKALLYEANLPPVGVLTDASLLFVDGLVERNPAKFTS